MKNEILIIVEICLAAAFMFTVPLPWEMGFSHCEYSYGDDWDPCEHTWATYFEAIQRNDLRLGPMHGLLPAALIGIIIVTWEVSTQGKQVKEKC